VSLRWRLALVLAVTVVVAVAAAAYAGFVFTSRELRGEADEFLFDRAALVAGIPQVAELFDPDFEPGSGNPQGGGFGRRPGFGRGAIVVADFDAVVQVIDSDGRIAYGFAEGPALPVEATDRRVADDGKRAVYRDIEIDDKSFRLITYPMPTGGAVQVARDVSGSETVLIDLRNRLLLVGLVGAALAAMVGWLVARRTVRPVEELTRAAEHVAVTQELAAPIEVTTTDEVGRLGHAFNTMLGALETSRRQQQRLVIDASHELRTPLTSLRTNIEMLQRAPDMEPAEHANLLADVKSELDELTNLVTELVELATDRRTDEPIQEVRLDEIARSVVERAERRTGRTVGITAEPTVVMGRPQMLERALSNLVDNAHKWGPPGSPISVTVSGGAVEVADAGPGIAPEDRPYVFDRFYRATAARAMPGSGLGLAIVKQIVDTHGGEVWVEGREGGGAVVGFRIPTAPAPAYPAPAPIS